jgi:hypothetical protein
MPAQEPTALTLRTYQVGFGDCFLLTFHYPKSERHMLIDFGSTKRAAKGPTMQAIADDIAKVTNGKLHVVVATHRHADHISGFAGDSGATIAKLQPDAVLQPWTEHPDAARDATKSPDQRGLRGQHVAALNAMHVVSQAVLGEVGRLGIRGAVAQQLRFLGEDNIQNPGAVKTLMKMKGRRYLAFGDDPKLGSILPNVGVHVLGPPTLEQSAEIRKQRAKDPEYWHLVSDHANFWSLQAAAAATSSASARPVFARRHCVATIPLEAQWFCTRLRTSRGDELLQIVRELDKAMNNTSLILLLEVGRLKLLFPGDAQIENWQYALKEAAAKSSPLRKLLQDVDVYKVGHHGSLNATPKTLWGMFARRGSADRKGRLQTFMSTLPGKHGDEASKTEVPRHALVDALRKDSTLVRTDELAAGVRCDVHRIAV